ncbi:MAG TPA: 5-formyltetrahydrofolate cyclo-ligase [Proteobacteria bacterium]|nr:5-formyltetrahydrofolate cyclo-ligase [Pseudomonadota bacterium]
MHDLNRDLAPGAFGIPEPRGAELPEVDEDEIELVVTPGAAFDMLGYRLGYGGGFYDRLFAQIRPDCLKVGIAFSFQLVDSVPHEPTDVPVDIVVTDQHIIRAYELREEISEARSPHKSA